jgi:hypothetical protein
MQNRNDAPPAYLRFGKRRLRVPKHRVVRIAFGVALIISDVLPPAFALLSIDIPCVRRWRRRMVVWLGRRKQRP